MISRKKNLTKILKHAIEWPKSEKENDEEEEEEKKSEKVVCVRCHQQFTELENKVNTCSYHLGSIFDSALPPKEWSLFRSEEEARQYVIRAKLKNQQKEEKERREPIMKYICCWRDISDPGCIKATHSTDKNAHDMEKLKNAKEYQKRLTSFQ